MTKIDRSSIVYESMDFSVHRYHAMIQAGVLSADDKVELLDGKIVPMSPVGRLHAACVLGLSEIFSARFLGKYTLKSQDPITIVPLSEPEPDYIIARYDVDRYTAGHPQPEDIHLLIEVSDSTLDKDRNYKLRLYAASSIPEYWIINLVDRQFEVYTQPDGVSSYLDQLIYREGERFQHNLLGEIDTVEFLPRIKILRRD
ncbi:Uma2 family endonuclease [Neolewinella sp.]|uniref:Uma2 family endonuclease n=1 Tax=Neolewinella sp. TaxID=2993543 RepID=UPI003B526A0B